MQVESSATPLLTIDVVEKIQRQRIASFITGCPDVVCVNILIFTWTKWDESSKLP